MQFAVVALTTQTLLALSFDCELMTLRDLESQRAALKLKKLELSAQIKQAGRSRGNASQSQSTLADLVLHLGSSPMAEATEIVVPPQLAGHKMKAHVLALYELSGYSTDAVASWLLGQGKGRRGGHRYDPEARDRMRTGVEWLYIRTPLQELEAPLISNSTDIGLLGRYVVEYQLFHWLLKQNCDVGINPQTPQFLAEALRCMPSALPSAEKEKLRQLFEVSTRKTRKWITSFRTRWDIKDGMLVPGEVLEPVVMQEKVSQGSFYGNVLCR